jgi:hypothetical protein
MTASVQQLINAFDGLSPPEKHEAAIEIIRRMESLPSSDLTDEALTEIADLTFQELDAREAEDAKK